MRSARLFALVMALPRGRLVRADDLAAHLEVSVRTIYRDLRVLDAAGVPIRTVAGPEGGVGLVDGWHSPVSGMTTDEARALLLGGAGADLGLGHVLATARSKVRAGLPERVHGELDAIARCFLLDTSAWFREDERGPLEVVASAVWSGQRLDLVYPSGDRPARRRVDPLGLVLKAGRWYLVAAHRGRLRTYRVARVRSAQVRTETARRPADFDLAAWWAASQESFARDLQRDPTRLALHAASLPHLRAAVPGPLTAAAIEAGLLDGEHDGRVHVDLPVENEQVALAQLSGVPEVEVLSPPTLRRRLAEHARALADRNA